MTKKCTSELIAAVHADLVALRGAHGRLTVQKFSQYMALRLVCGGGDLLEAYLAFERELRRYATEGNRNEAAALSISAPMKTVLDRLEEVVSLLDDTGEGRDQRTARRWSDQGFTTIATEMVHVAEVRGRLGNELLTIELFGTRASLNVVVWQLTNKPARRAGTSRAVLEARRGRSRRAVRGTHGRSRSGRSRRIGE